MVPAAILATIAVVGLILLNIVQWHKFHTLKEMIMQFENDRQNDYDTLNQRINDLERKP